MTDSKGDVKDNIDVTTETTTADTARASRRRFGSTAPDDDSITNIKAADNRLLAELGYSAEFKREFSVRSSCLFSFNSH